MRSEVLTVRQLSEQLRRNTERCFPYVWVQGEVTNISRPVSGHVYFSLKEDECLLNCVWFRGRQKAERFDPLTGEVWQDGPHACLAASIETGQTLLCAGALSAYTARSQYQLIVEHAMPYGMGAWHMQFEALKKKLAAEGLFDQALKRPIPHAPRRVAVVTAPRGAAIHDFLRIAGERGVAAEIRLFPAPVQGEDAPPRIIEALQKPAAGCGGDSGGAWLPEVIVLIRGGGSMQDLWAFNDEGLARAVRSSPIPVLTGIGHEIDLSITDMASDYSAATPSHAAQLLWTERAQILAHVQRLEQALFQSMDDMLELLEGRSSNLAHTLKLLSPTVRLNEKRLLLENSVRSMESAIKRSADANEQALERVLARLEANSSAIAERREPALKSMSYRLCRAGDSMLSAALQQSERASSSLLALGRHLTDIQERQADTLAARLEALDPFAPLKRGYALAFAQDGSNLQSIAQAKADDLISIHIKDGVIKARVEGMESSP